MASMRHEVLVDLFKNRPSLAAEILTEVLGASLPAYTEARLTSIDLTEIKPAEYRADVVVLLVDGDRAVRVIIVEVQLNKDDDKPYTWPAYLTVARDQYRCQADLLVVAPDPVVADWCAQAIEIGVAGVVLRPPVLPPRRLPGRTGPPEAAPPPGLPRPPAVAARARAPGAGHPRP